MSLKIAIRTDASPTIGHGHVIRCLTLANRLSQSGIQCHFISVSMPEVLEAQLIASGHSFVRLSDDEAVAEQLAVLQPHWLIVDHYEIDLRLEQEWASVISKPNIMVIDDLADRKHHCDILLDVTPGRSADAYAHLVPANATLCIGADYALIAGAFVELRDTVLQEREMPVDLPHVLVTLGGGEVAEEMRSVAMALKSVAEHVDFSTTVIAGGVEAGMFEPLDSFEVLASVTDMAQRMSGADYCIGAAGGTSWERCCLGLPTIALQIADNQKDNFEFLKISEAAVCVPCDASRIAASLEHLMTSNDTRLGLVHRSSQVCDGRGASRVRDQILSKTFAIRAATLDDAKFIYQARYAGGMERFYRNPVKPDFADHLAWLKNVLSASDRLLLIVELDGEAIAHVRFDDAAEHGETEIGIAIDEAHRGNGYGSAVLLAACADQFSKGYSTIHAEIGTDNHASLRIFENAGFVATGETRDSMALYAMTA